MDKFALHKAAEEGDLERVRQLIEGGLSVDSRDDRGLTPLHRAAEWGRYEVVDLLISSKCDLNAKNHDCQTPVFSAAIGGRKDVVHLLLQHGAQVNCADPNNETFLHRASENGWSDVVQSILERGEADVNAARMCGETPLMWAARGGHGDVAALLIRAGADVHRSDAYNWTALHWASFNGDTKVVNMLLGVEGLDLNPQDGASETPLHIACKFGHREVIRQLLIAGADTTIKNKVGETALSKGIKHRKLNIEDIRLLMQHGAYIEDGKYVPISWNPVIKEIVLKDVHLCTQSIVNKFHRQSLPALKGKFTGRLPSIQKFNLLPEHICDVENFVKWDIQVNTFCNVIQARPIVLRIMCVESLLAACQSAMKRSAASDFSKSNSPFKKPHSN